MAPPKKSGGRVTPKGTQPGAPRSVPTAGAPPVGEPRHANASSSRYTPPTPKYVKESPPWVAWLMFSLLIVGLFLIVLGYMGLLPGSKDNPNWYLVAGLVAMFGGIITATKLR
ncbi:MAG TPA: cell division protein CrgA [Acidimicrobiales bacterium]